MKAGQRFAIKFRIRDGGRLKQTAIDVGDANMAVFALQVLLCWRSQGKRMPDEPPDPLRGASDNGLPRGAAAPLHAASGAARAESPEEASVADSV